MLASTTTWPLSSAQLAMWLGQQVDPASSAYSMAFHVELLGPVDVELLCRAVERMTAEADTLHLRVVVQGDQPMQHLAPAEPVPPEIVSLDDSSRLDDWLAADLRKPFDIYGRLFTHAILTTPAGRTHWYFKYHHIIGDGQTSGLLVERVATIYTALAGGRPVPPAGWGSALALAEFDRTPRAVTRRERDRDHWLRTLSGWASAGARDAVEAGPPALTLRAVVDIPKSTVDGVLGLAERAGVSWPTVMVAAVAVYVRERTSQQDMILRLPVSGRTEPAARRVPGLAANAVPVRLSLSPGQSLGDFLRDVSWCVTKGLLHQRCPVEDVLSALPGRPAPGQLFSASVNVIRLDNRFRLGAGEGVGHLLSSGPTDEPAVMVYGNPDARRMAMCLDLNAARHTGQDLERFERQLLAVLAALVAADPLGPLGAVRLPAEVGRIRSAGPISSGEECVVTDLFAAQADETPDAIAVEAAGQRLTYRELDDRANCLATVLIERGVRPETPVALAMPRSVHLIVAVLAVLKAGACYVPLDPRYPPRRLRSIMTATGSRLALTTVDSEIGDLGSAVTRLAVDELAQSPDMPSAQALPLVDPDCLAYIVHTSGSSGAPKGVAVPHRGLLNRTLWTVRNQKMTPADRVLQKTPLSFDAAAWECLAPLVSGGTLVLAAVGAEQDPAGLLREVARHGITVLQVVPSVLRLLLDEPNWAGCTSLRLVSSGGEPLRAELAQRLFDRVETALWNTYGPTECSIDATAGLADPAQTSGPVPIGRPIDNTFVRVLDPDGREVPVGVAGELHVGGVGLARGYVGRPDLTAERFVPDPLGTGGRLYRTGDLARWRDDGTLDYLGRLDDQVKVNGVRIEPGEVEAAVVEHPDVTGAVVRAVTGDRGTHLVAYVACADDLPAAELREFLSRRLPDSLIPAVFVSLRELPLTVSGKVDRQSLANLTTRGPFVAPRTDMERTVARAWAEILAGDDFGVDDDFFEQGGSSLTLTALARNLSAVTGVQVPFRKLFSRATVTAQANLLNELAAAMTEAQPVAGSAPLSYGQERLWFLDQVSPASPEWVVPVFMRLESGIDPELVRTALAAVARRHATLRTRYQVDAGSPRQLVDPAPVVELDVVRCGADEVPDHCARQVGRGFDLANGPVWRAMLVLVEAGAPLLLVTVHHSVFDGRSAVVLERDFRELCRVGGDPAASDLPALPLSYVDFARRQRAELTDEIVAEELTFWQRELSSVPSLDLPIDRARPPVRDPSGAVETCIVPSNVADQLVAVGRQSGATAFTVFLTAFAALLARVTDRWDIVVGTAADGRDRPEVQDMIGFFVNSVALRCRLASDMSFAAAVESVRHTCRAAFTHQALPFERVVEGISADRDPSRTPVFQVGYDLYQDGATNAAITDDDVHLLARSRRATRTDLSLILRRTPDGGLQCGLEYATSLFEPETVARMARQLVCLLTSVAAEPDIRLADVPLLDPAERDLLLAQATGPAVGPTPGTVSDMIAHQMARTPEATAVISADGRLTFRELDRRANQMAARLRAAGVRVGSVVGVLLPRGPDLIVTLLAVWRSGAAYLPLDVGTPRRRLDRILGTSGAAVVVTTPGFAEDIECPVVFAGSWSENDDAGHQEIDPDWVAYLIYTSGSTGYPKGVRITHRSLANYVRWAADAFGSRGSGGAPVFSSVAFDLVVPSLFVPLVTGRPVHLLPPNLPLDELGATLTRGGPYSFVKLTPAHLDLLRLRLSPAEIDHLARIYVVGGDQFHGAEANWWLGVLGPGRLLNEYGPTEATVGIIAHPVDDHVTTDAAPIGRPLPGATAYVLDRQLRLVPSGATGELYVGGVGLARGYVDPAQTAEWFLPNPYGEPGSRLYRTGDLVSRDRSGALTFLGRADDQVKINGYRVEPAETRTVLLEHPAVRDAVVLARRLNSGVHQLAGYVVPRGEVTAAELIEYCRERLPDYLVPSRLVTLERLPLNENGKIDRGALAAGEPVPPTPPDSHGVEADPVRERIAEIWRELLQVPVNDNETFYAQGGHSLLLLRMVAMVRDAFGVALPAAVAIKDPTIARLAEFVTAQIKAEVAAMTETEAAAALNGEH